MEVNYLGKFFKRRSIRIMINTIFAHVLLVLDHFVAEIIVTSSRLYQRTSCKTKLFLQKLSFDKCFINDD